MQLQAGLGRPAGYKNEAMVAAALGLRTVMNVAHGSRSTWAAYRDIKRGGLRADEKRKVEKSQDCPYGSLFTVHCLLFTVHCLLFTVYCSLFTDQRTRRCLQ